VFVSENGIKFVRIDGSTLQRERKEAVDSFRLDPEVCPSPVFFVTISSLFLVHVSNNSQFGLIFIHYWLVFFSKKLKIVIIGITAGGVGLDFSSAQNVVFVELPKSASELLQVLSHFFSHSLLLQFLFDHYRMQPKRSKSI